MYNRRTKLLPKIILGQLAVTLLITAMSLSILFYAEGYRLNLRHFKVIKTGIIAFTSYPKNAKVYLDGRLKRQKTPCGMNLMPGYYSVEVKEDGYASWSADGVKVEAGLVDDFKNVVLFKSYPEISDLKDERKINLINSPDDYLAIRSQDLYYNDYEIWYKNSLVTRFSSPIYKAKMYTSDDYHIVFQRGNEIRVIETTGNNDTLLVKLSSSTPTLFTISNKGDELYYLDSGQYKMAKIR